MLTRCVAPAPSQCMSCYVEDIPCRLLDYRVDEAMRLYSLILQEQRALYQGARFRIGRVSRLVFVASSLLIPC